jgi:hypothetical protein
MISHGRYKNRISDLFESLYRGKGSRRNRERHEILIFGIAMTAGPNFMNTKLVPVACLQDVHHWSWVFPGGGDALAILVCSCHHLRRLERQRTANDMVTQPQR